jgi:hypothetical protein
MRLFFTLLFCLFCALQVGAADEKPRGSGGGKQGGQRGPQRPPGQDAAVDDVRFLFKTDVPAHPVDVVLGRPTASAITASIVSYQDREGMVEYGIKGGAMAKTPVFKLAAGEPLELPLTGLTPDSEYAYTLSFRTRGGAWETEPMRSFRTQRRPGSSFAFTMQADPHLDYNTEPALYLRCLANALADHPDFHIDLGDTFMTDKHRGRETAEAQYKAQRFYFSRISHSAPLYLVLGNHDAEAGRWLDGTGTNLAVWSNQQRKKYFPNPIPDGFYSGNKTPDPHAGMLQNYYGWEWGDALFLALDPFWFTTRQKGADEMWGRTLGSEQYNWLASTLAASKARFRFVFIHHLVGGAGKDARGGRESAPFYEWGGKDASGAVLFAEKRAGWPMPIHQLLAKHGVQIVFHGHDHLYVKEDLDGIVYQEVPQPGHPRYDNTRSAEEYGYKSGVIQGSSGHLRVVVHPDKAVVSYVRAYLPADETPERRNAAVSHTYEVAPFAGSQRK